MRGKHSRYVCRKQPFRSRQAAEECIAMLREKRAAQGNERVECRAYYHEHCHRWHMTSMPKGATA